MRHLKLTLSLLLPFLLTPSLAQATDTAQPSETTETFGSWVVRCQKPTAEAPRNCEVLHGVQAQGGLVAQVAIGTPPGTQEPLVVVQTPLGVLVSQSVTLTDAAATEPLLAIPFQTCLQIGCIAQLGTTNELLDTFARAQAAKLSFLERTGRRVDISIPLTGLKDALARLREG